MENTNFKVGVAKIDITPDYPIRLSGYGSRRDETEKITQRIFAKSIAICYKNDLPFVIVCVENCGVPDWMTEKIADRLRKKLDLPRENFVISVTHTHSAPFLSGMLETIFGEPIKKDHRKRIDRYTQFLTDAIEKVAKLAIDHRKSANLAWTEGSVGFGKNRRTEGGPVDHALPLLLATNENGIPIAIWTSYACHATVLDLNEISGDWPGYAMEKIEADHPTVLAMISIGCAADTNPLPRREIELAEKYGRDFANEVDRLLDQDLTPISDQLHGKFTRVDLPFDTIPTRQEWEDRRDQGGAVGYHAEVQLEKLDRGEALQTELSYPVQVWNFGDQLAIAFLSGEVVVDFSHRLKREFDRNRFWINAYCNDLPCYIPSVRILNEGGYEGKTAMLYFNRPTHFKPEVEEIVVSAVHDLIPKKLRVKNEE